MQHEPEDRPEAEAAAQDVGGDVVEFTLGSDLDGNASANYERLKAMAMQAVDPLLFLIMPRNRQEWDLLSRIERLALGDALAVQYVRCDDPASMDGTLYDFSAPGVIHAC